VYVFLSIRLSVEKGIYAVCKLKEAYLPQAKDFLSLTVTEEEFSLVCKQESIPAVATKVQGDFALLKLEGHLDFSLVGILAGISDALAKEKISIFCVSTYNTDYILLREKELERGISALQKNDYVIDI
jgi:uncharacterized protein